MSIKKQNYFIVSRYIKFKNNIKVYYTGIYSQNIFLFFIFNIDFITLQQNFCF